MRYIWQIISLILAAVLVLTLALTLDANNESEGKDESDIVINSIMTRSSVRQYTGKQVSDTMIDRVLRAGMAAPTAGNKQAWSFYVIQNRDVIKQFTKVNKNTAPMNMNALTAIIVCGVPEESMLPDTDYWVQDCSAATENILLAAHALGLGAVWCGVYPVEERVSELYKLVDIEEGLVPLNIIMLGHPSQEPQVKDKWKPEKVKWVR